MRVMPVMPARRPRLVALALVAASLAACGDDLVTSAGGSESAGTTDGDTDATTIAPTTSPTTDATTSTATGTASDSESGTSEGETTAVSTTRTSDDTTTIEPTTTGDPTTTTGDPTTTTGGPTTTGDPTTTTTGDGDTDTDTSTGGDPIACADDTLPFAGELCGPPELPCVVVASEAASAGHHFRNEAPAITVDTACDPRILYSVAEGGYHGFFARREGPDTWTTAETPFAIARVGLAHDYAGDRTLALAYNGAFGTSLWSWQGDVWTPDDAVMGQHIASAHAFARGGDGVLHAALYGSDNLIRVARHDGSWMLADVAGQATASTALALDPDGAPHLTLWRSQGPNWELTYAAPPMAVEPAFSLGSNVLNLSLHGVAVIPGDGDPLTMVPYIVHARRAGQLHGIVLTRRVGVGKWSSDDVIVEDDQNASLCQGEPQTPGETCDYDYVRYRPLTIVASAGGDVRFFYGMTHHLGTLTAECVDLPFPMCFWTPLVDKSEAELRIGWPTEQGPAWATLAEGIFATDLTVVVDANGRFHAAIYDTEGEDEPMVRYLAFE